MKTIQAKVFTRFLAVITVFFVIMGMAATYLTVHLTSQFAVTDNQKSLAFLVNNIRSSYFSHLSALDEVAQKPELRNLDRAGAQQVVSDFLAFNSVFSTVHLYRADGALMFAEKHDEMYEYDAEPNFKQMSNRFVKLAEQVMSTGKPVATPTFYTRSDVLYQLYLTPVKDPGGQVVGLLSGGVFPKMRSLGHLVDGMALAPENFIYIADYRDRTIVKNGTVPEQWESSRQECKVERCMDGMMTPLQLIGSSIQHLFGLRQTPDYVVFSEPISDLQLTVYLGLNHIVLENKINTLLRNLLVTFLICFIGALAYSVIVGRSLAKPLQVVMDATKEIDRGNFDFELDAARTGELKDLGDSLDRIRRKIRRDHILGDLWGDEIRS